MTKADKALYERADKYAKSIPANTHYMGAGDIVGNLLNLIDRLTAENERLAGVDALNDEMSLEFYKLQADKELLDWADENCVKIRRDHTDEYVNDHWFVDGWEKEDLRAAIRMNMMMSNELANNASLKRASAD